MNRDVLIVLCIAGMFFCLAALFATVIYFIRGWKKMDRMLEEFQNGNFSDAQEEERHIYPSDAADVRETRESRVVGELRQILNNAYFKQTQAVGEKNEVMELISDLSHQLKTPLANLVMDAELLQKEDLTPSQKKEFLEHIKGQTEKMQWLMDSLLKASRLENGMIDFKAENTGIRETLARAVSAVWAQAAKKQIVIEMEESADLTLYHNLKWTAEALANILENAVKYSPQGSVICIGITPLDIYTRITIADQGIGIAKEEYNRIFTRFYRGARTAQEEGNGLGLYLAQLILMRENGYITVNSKVGEGSCFSVFLLNEG